MTDSDLAPTPLVIDVAVYTLVALASAAIAAVILYYLARFLVVAPPAPLERFYALVRAGGRPQKREGRHTPARVQARLREAVGSFAAADTAILARHSEYVS